ncbi:MAG: adenine-specific methyltransferase EcoRI family protein [Ekhidna sp.]|nr:adenine-specific methyltransferase EcoRI family protein [Ekhidna sp.]
MAKNRDLQQAKRQKRDEFYTQLTDIEKECKHYKDHFRGKVIYCNCDDPTISNFFRYFSLKFNQLGLKKLIATCYRSNTPDLFSRHDCDTGLSLGFIGTKEPTGRPQKEDIQIHYLEGDGDFRSHECIELLKESDIVCTNPPFSLFREFVAQLIEYDKQFLIIGNVNAITYKELFPFIKDNKLWLGPSITSGDREFGVPDSYPLEAATYRVDENGNKFIRVKGVRWFTNLDYKKRHEELILIEEYTPEDYPKYDNYDAINIDKVLDIPKEYDGAMGVPITFLDKFNPDQFEILDANEYRLRPELPHKQHGLIKDNHGTVKGKNKYCRIVIKHKGL